MIEFSAIKIFHDGTITQCLVFCELLSNWSTGETLDCDLTDTIKRHTAFATLADPSVFAQVVVEEWGHGLDWPGGLDMGADRLYQLCREQARSGSRPIPKTVQLACIGWEALKKAA